MNPSFRSLLLTTTIAILSGTRPGIAAGPERAVQSGMEWWRLRPTDVLTTGATSPAPTKTPAATAVPEERRAVRVVYPGLVDGR